VAELSQTPLEDKRCGILISESQRDTAATAGQCREVWIEASASQAGHSQRRRWIARIQTWSRNRAGRIQRPFAHRTETTQTRRCDHNSANIFSRNCRHASERDGAVGTAVNQYKCAN